MSAELLRGQKIFAGGFSLLNARRSEPVLSSRPGRDFISARLAKANREHNALCSRMHAAPFGSALC